MLIGLFLHIALTVRPTPAVPSGLIDAAVAEAAGIWAPYGVTIDAAPDGCAECGACGAIDDHTRALTVVAIETRRSAVAPGWHGALGAITFAPDGAPAPLIRCSSPTSNDSSPSGSSPACLRRSGRRRCARRSSAACWGA